QPRTKFRHVRICMMFIPADAQTDDKSALFSNRYRSASRLGRTGFETQSSIVLAITPRHRRGSAVISISLASVISLTMMGTPLSAGAECRDCRFPIKLLLLKVQWRGRMP